MPAAIKPVKTTGVMPYYSDSSDTSTTDDDEEMQASVAKGTFFSDMPPMLVDPDAYLRRGIDLKADGIESTVIFWFRGAW